MNRSIVAGLLSAAALLAGEAGAHELFLTLDKHQVQPNQAMTLRLLNGTFEESAGPVPRNRMRDVSVLGAAGTTHPEASGWSDVNKESRLVVQVDRAGTYVAGVSTEYTVSERSAEQFAEYLQLEGLPDVLAKYDKSAYPQGVRYRYSKHARALIQVGKAQTQDYARTLGYATEITLTRHPSALKVGDTVSFKATYKGAPLAGQLVHFGRGTAGQAAAGRDHGAGSAVRTDKNGVAQLEITAPGIWYVYLNRMEKSQTAGFDFDSDRASLTFAVMGRGHSHHPR